MFLFWSLVAVLVVLAIILAFIGGLSDEEIREMYRQQFYEYLAERKKPKRRRGDKKDVAEDKQEPPKPK